MTLVVSWVVFLHGDLEFFIDCVGGHDGRSALQGLAKLGADNSGSHWRIWFKLDGDPSLCPAFPNFPNFVPLTITAFSPQIFLLRPDILHPPSNEF